MSTKSKPVRFASHLTPFAAIANIIGLDPITFKKVQGSAGLTTTEQLQQCIGLTTALPLTEIKESSEMTAVTVAIGKLSGALQEKQAHDSRLVSTLTEHLAAAGDKVLENFRTKQNGAGEHPQAVPAGQDANKAFQSAQ
jgi:hypothetical protein